MNALTALSVDISAVMDILPHATPLGADEKVRAQGRMLRLKTSLDHAAGLEGDDRYTSLLRAAASEALQLIDPISWTSDPDRKWYGALFEALTRVERHLKAA
jgi:hypothetical protein